MTVVDVEQNIVKSLRCILQVKSLGHTDTMQLHKKTYLLIFFLQFGSLGLIGSLVFGTLCRPQLAKLLGDVTNGNTGIFLLDPGTVIRAEHEECRTGREKRER